MNKSSRIMLRRRKLSTSVRGIGALSVVLCLGGLLFAARPRRFVARILAAKPVTLTGSVNLVSAVSCRYHFHRHQLTCIEPPFARGSHHQGAILAVRGPHGTVYIAGCLRKTPWSACGTVRPGQAVASWHQGQLKIHGKNRKHEPRSVAYRVIRIELPPHGKSAGKGRGRAGRQ